MRSRLRSAPSSQPCPGRCTATSTPASTCSARSFATASSAADCLLPHHFVRAACRPAWHEHVSALRRLHGQLYRFRLRLRHAARLRQAGRAVCAGRGLGWRTSAAGRLDRLRTDADPYRHQLCRVFPQQRRSQLSPICHPIPPGHREHPTSASSSCAAIGLSWRSPMRPTIRWISWHSTVSLPPLSSRDGGNVKGTFDGHRPQRRA